MFGRKQKIKLSKNLKLGVSGPASQSALFKVGGVFFLAMSILLAVNIYNNVKGRGSNSAAPEIKISTEPQVLGVFDSKTETSPPQIISYSVKKGDTLFNIAQKHHIGWQIIATLNNLKPPYSLKIGSTLKIPAVK